MKTTLKYCFLRYTKVFSHKLYFKTILMYISRAYFILITHYLIKVYLKSHFYINQPPSEIS